MPIGSVRRTSTNYNVPIANFNAPVWQKAFEQMVDIFDAAIFAFTGIGNTRGVWDNATEYVQNQRVVDEDNGTLWRVLVTHVSNHEGTFAEARAEHPERWKQVTNTASNVGEFASGMQYNANSFITDGYRVGIIVDDYLSGDSYDEDVANEQIVTLIDLTPIVDEVQTDRDQVREDRQFVEQIIADADDGPVVTVEGKNGFVILSNYNVDDDIVLERRVTYGLTTTSPITLTLPADPVVGDWIKLQTLESVSPTTHHEVSGNGHTIMESEEPLVLNIRGVHFTIWYNGSDWRLF